MGIAVKLDASTILIALPSGNNVTTFFSGMDTAASHPCLHLDWTNSLPIDSPSILHGAPPQILVSLC